MSNRRDFLKTAAFAALGSGMAINHVFAGGNDAPSLFNVNSRAGVTPKMKLRFFPYELKLRHVFTVATYSRTTTPDVQVEIEYDGIIGYGEASMPPYLQHELGTMDSVLAFLKKVQDVIGQFSDPFQLEDILAYIDSLSAGDSAAKTAVDIALHDLVGKLLQAPWYKIWGLDKEKIPCPAIHRLYNCSSSCWKKQATTVRLSSRPAPAPPPNGRKHRKAHNAKATGR